MTPETLLTSRLQDDKIWRIRELSELVRACSDASGLRQDALLRASVPVMYAHWEGYFVLAANSYLTFISEKTIKMSGLRDEFWALSVRKRYKSSQVSGDAAFNRFLLELRSESDRIFKKGNFERINGKSNLNSEVLSFCCKCIGINYAAFSEYVDFIDRSLIDKRNHIAHGSSLRFEKEKVSEFRDQVVDLMRITQTEIENTVTSTAYLKPIA